MVAVVAGKISMTGGGGLVVNLSLLAFWACKGWSRETFFARCSVCLVMMWFMRVHRSANKVSQQVSFQAPSRRAVSTVRGALDAGPDRHVSISFVPPQSVLFAPHVLVFEDSPPAPHTRTRRRTPPKPTTARKSSSANHPPRPPP